MRREFIIAGPGLACCRCSDNVYFAALQSGERQNKESRLNKKCSLDQGLAGCCQCDDDCQRGLPAKVKPQGFLEFAKWHRVEKLPDCWEENKRGDAVYHRKVVITDENAFDKSKGLLKFIRTSVRKANSGGKEASRL